MGAWAVVDACGGKARLETGHEERVRLLGSIVAGRSANGCVEVLVQPNRVVLRPAASSFNVANKEAEKRAIEQLEALELLTLGIQVADFGASNVTRALLRREAAVASLLSSDPQRARRLAEESVQLNPVDAGGHFVLAKSYCALQKFACARAHLETAMSIAPQREDFQS